MPRRPSINQPVWGTSLCVVVALAAAGCGEKEREDPPPRRPGAPRRVTVDLRDRAPRQAPPDDTPERSDTAKPPEEQPSAALDRQPQELVSRLSSKQAGVRSESARELERLGPAAAAALAGALRHSDGFVRDTADELLRKLGPKAAPASPELAKVLRKGDGAACLRALRIVSTIGPPAAEHAGEAIMGTIWSNDPHVVEQSFRAMVRLELAEETISAAFDEVLGRERKDSWAGALRAMPDLPLSQWQIARACGAGLKAEHPQVRLSAAEAMLAAELSPDLAVPLCAKALGGEDYAVHGKVAKYLARLGPNAKSAVPALLDSLMFSTAGYWHIADALERIEPNRLQLAKHAGARLRGAPRPAPGLAALLARLGAVSADEVAAMLEADDPLVRILAIKTFAKVLPDTRPLPEAFVKRLEDGDTRVRFAAMIQLGSFGPRGAPAAPALARLLETDARADWLVVAAGALGGMGPEALSAVDALVGVRSVGIPGTYTCEDAQREAVRALVRLGPAAVPALARAAARDPQKAKLARRAMRGLAPRAVDELRAIILDGAKSQRPFAVEALSALDPPPPELKPILLRGLEMPDPSARAAAAATLARYAADDGEVFSALTRQLWPGTRVGDPARPAVARALGELGPALTPALPDLIKMLKGADQEAAAYAAELVRRIGRRDEDVSAALKIAFGRVEGKYSGPVGVALAELGDPSEVIDVFRMAMASRTGRARYGAVLGLARLGRHAKPAVADLIRAIEHGHVETRLAAIRALGAIGADASSALRTLRHVVDNPAAPGRAKRLAALAILQIDPLRPAEDAGALFQIGLRGDQEEERTEFMRALSEMNPPPVALAEELLQAAEGNRGQVAVYAAEAYAKLLGGMDDQIPRLIADLRSGRSLTVRGARLVLERLAEGAVEPLLWAYRGREGDPPLVAADAPGGRDPAPWREEIAELIRHAGPAAVEHLVPLLKDPQEGMRRFAAAALRDIAADLADSVATATGADAALDALSSAVHSDDPWVQQTAVAALSLAGRPAGDAVPMLMRELRRGESAALRAGAADALVSLGAAAAPAVPELIELLDTDRANLAVPVLGAIGAQAAGAVPALAERVRHAADDGARRQAIEALARIGPPAHAALGTLAELALLGTEVSPVAERAWWAIRHNLVTPLRWMSLEVPGAR